MKGELSFHSHSQEQWTALEPQKHFYHLGSASSSSHAAGNTLSGWGVVSMERTRSPGMKPLGLQRPLRTATTFSELLLSLSPTRRDPRTI